MTDLSTVFVSHLLLWDECVGVNSRCDAQEATDTDAGEMKITSDVSNDDSKLDPV